MKVARQLCVTFSDDNVSKGAIREWTCHPEVHLAGLAVSQEEVGAEGGGG